MSHRARTSSTLDRFRAGWLGLALVLTSATQLRFGSLPIGPGELLLAGWLLFTLAVLATNGVAAPRASGKVLLGFWGFGLGALLLGWIVGLASGESSPAHGRDFVAFLFMTAMIVGLVVDPRLRDTMIQAVRVVTVVGILSVAAIVIAMALLRRLELGPIQPIYGDARFRGWADNPNQLALLLLALPVAAVRFGLTAPPPTRVGWAGLAVIALGLGVATGSDALRAAWGAMTALALVALWVRLAIGPLTRRPLGALAALALPVVAAALVLGVGAATVDVASAKLTEIFETGGQGQDRLGRWVFGLEAIAASPAVGLGPGAFSGASGPFQGQEAHNSVVDWAASTGALGFAALTALALAAAALLVSRRQAVSGTVGIGLVVFASLHYVFRQPLAWFLILASLEGIFDRPRGREVPDGGN